MILFEHEGKKYKLLFRHPWNPVFINGFDPFSIKAKVKAKWKRKTVAFICEQGKNQPVLYEAHALCSVEDNYVKDTGRLLALTRLQKNGCPEGLADAALVAYTWRKK